MAWRAEKQCLSVRLKTNQKTEPRQFGKLYLRVCRRRRRRRRGGRRGFLIPTICCQLSNRGGRRRRRGREGRRRLSGCLDFALKEEEERRGGWGRVCFAWFGYCSIIRL